MYMYLLRHMYAKDKIGIEVLLLKFDNFIKINNINNKIIITNNIRIKCPLFQTFFYIFL